MKRERYIGTLDSNTSSVEFRLAEQEVNSVRGAGIPDGGTYTVELGVKDGTGTVVYGDVADNTATDEFGFKINSLAEWCRVTSSGAGSSENFDIFGTTLN